MGEVELKLCLKKVHEEKKWSLKSSCFFTVAFLCKCVFPYSMFGFFFFFFFKLGRAGSGSGRNLWVSGLSSSTRATDLKNLFSKYGKVCSGYAN